MQYATKDRTPAQERLIELLRQPHGATSFTIQEELNSSNVQARVNELRVDGWPISVTHEADCARYRITGPRGAPITGARAIHVKWDGPPIPQDVADRAKAAALAIVQAHLAASAAPIPPSEPPSFIDVLDALEAM